MDKKEEEKKKSNFLHFVSFFSQLYSFGLYVKVCKDFFCFELFHFGNLCGVGKFCTKFK